MKINKIICDVCENEINLETDEALAMFEFIQTQTKLNIIPVMPLRKDLGDNKEIVKTTYDLCKRCAEMVEKFLKEKKDQLKNKVDKN